MTYEAQKTSLIFVKVMNFIIAKVLFVFVLLSCNSGQTVRYENHENGKVKREIFSNNGKTFLIKTYLESGPLNYTLEISEGKRNGKETIYNIDGSVKSIRFYVNDKLFGFGLTFNKDSSISRVLEYRNDSLVKETFYE